MNDIERYNAEHEAGLRFGQGLLNMTMALFSVLVVAGYMTNRTHGREAPQPEGATISAPTRPASAPATAASASMQFVPGQGQ